jgi:autotransporter-associated beta strand protein
MQTSANWGADKLSRLPQFSPPLHSILVLSSIAGMAMLALEESLAAALPDQPYASYWYPNTVPAGGLGQSLATWNPANDPNAAFNISGVPLAARYTPAQVNPAVANTAAGVMSLPSFGSTSFNPSQGSQTMAYYDPTYWQYTNQLVFWGGSAGEGLILAPNPTVIDAAHRNGVPVLGTIFFPPTLDGGQISFVNDLLYTPDNGQTFPIAAKLVQMTNYYHFDGWFINQETEGGNSNTATLMQEFINYTHALAPTMQIDWYDAMTNTGAISYQNQLDTSDQMFFQNSSGTGTANRAADDIFLNYNWSSSGITKSATLASSLGRSPFNVYAGIDLTGSVGYNTSVGWSSLYTVVNSQNTPKVSLGLYSPTATYSGASGSSDLAKMQNFFANESLFWAGAKGDPSNTSGTVGTTSFYGIANYIQAQAVLPSASSASTFVTNFNPGVGQMYAVNGQVLATGEWNNLSLQDIMPTWRWLDVSSDASSTKLTPSFDFTRAYYGGASLSVTGNMTAYNNLSLYATQLAVSNSSNLAIAFTDGQAGAASMLQVALTFSDSSVGYLSCGTTTTAGWNTQTFSLGSYAGKTITGIGLELGNGGAVNNYSMNVGQILVYSGTQSTPAAPTNLQGMATGNVSSGTATLQLAWTHATGALSGSGNPTGAVYAYDIFQLSGGSQSFLGATPNNAYFVPSIVRSGTSNFATIEVQTVAADMGMSSYLTQQVYADWSRPAWNLTWQGNGYGSPGGSGTWSNSALTWHHDGDANATVDQPWSNSWGDTAVFSGSAAGSVVVSGSQAANQIVFNTPGYTLSGGSLILAGSGAGITANSIATINSTVDMGGGTGQIGGPNNLSIGGTLQNGSLTKFGSGILILSGTNTYSGGTTVSGGTLQLGDGVANNGSVPGNISNNAALVFANPAAQTFSGTISGSGSLVKIGSGPLSLTATQAYSGPTVISAGTVRLGPVFLPASLAGFGGNGLGFTITTSNIANYTTNAVPVTSNVLTLTDGSSHGSEARSIFYNTPISPANGFTASFTYTPNSGTNTADGVAFILQNDPRGASALGGNGGFFGYATGNGGSGISPSVAIDFNLYNNVDQTSYDTNGSLGTVTTISNVNLHSGDPINVSVSYNPQTQVMAWTLTDTVGNKSFSTLQAGVNLQSALSGTSALVGFSGADGGAVAKQTISNFSINYTIPAAGINVLPATTALFLAAGATLDLFGGTQTVGSLSGAGTLTNTAANSVSVLTAGGDNSSQTFSGLLQNGGGTLSLVKTGTGSLLLTGSNTYSGSTTINQGTLAVNNAASLGAASGSLSIGPAALEVTGGVSSARNIALTAADGTIQVDSSVTYVDSGVITGPGKLSKTGAGILVLSGSNTYQGGTDVEAGTLDVTLRAALPDQSSLTVGVGASSLFAAASGGPALFGSPNLAPLPVPEPSAFVLLASAAIGLATSAWKRRRRGSGLGRHECRRRRV